MNRGHRQRRRLQEEMLRHQMSMSQRKDRQRKVEEEPARGRSAGPKGKPDGVRLNEASAKSRRTTLVNNAMITTEVFCKRFLACRGEQRWGDTQWSAGAGGARPTTTWHGAACS